MQTLSPTVTQQGLYIPSYQEASADPAPERAGTWSAFAGDKGVHAIEFEGDRKSSRITITQWQPLNSGQSHLHRRLSDIDIGILVTLNRGRGGFSTTEQFRLVSELVTGLNELSPTRGRKALNSMGHWVVQSAGDWDRLKHLTGRLDRF